MQNMLAVEELNPRDCVITHKSKEDEENLPWEWVDLEISNTRTNQSFRIHSNVHYYHPLTGTLWVHAGETLLYRISLQEKDRSTIVYGLHAAEQGEYVSDSLARLIRGLHSSRYNAAEWSLASKEIESARRVETGKTGFSNSLVGQYFDGYEYELNFNFIEYVLAELRHRDKLRVLDVGFGNGQAVCDMNNLLALRGLVSKAYVMGIGMHFFDNLKTPNFKLTNVLDFQVVDEDRFDLLLSLRCLLWIPDQLRAVEHMYNNLLRRGGRAILQIPSSLIRFERKAPKLNQYGDWNVMFGHWNDNMLRRVISCKAKHMNIDYVVHPKEESSFFGTITITKHTDKKLRFPVELIKLSRVENYIASTYNIID